MPHLAEIAWLAAVVAAGSGGDVIEWRGGDGGDAPALERSTAGETARRLAELAAQAEIRRRHVVLLLERAPDAALRSRLARAGVDLLAPLGNGAFFASLDIDRLDQAALAAAPLRAAASIPAAVKLHPALRDEPPPWSRVVAADGAQRTALLVLFHPDIAAARAERVARRHGAVVRAALRTVNGLLVELDPLALDALAAEDAVQWIEPPLPAPAPMNSENRAVTQVAAVQAAPYGLDGAGVVVMIYDGGQAQSGHPDFGGRLVAGDTDGISGHATHVCGTIGGDGSASAGARRGMAPGVTMISYGFQVAGAATPLYTNPGDLENDYAEAIDLFGAALANNSLGSNTSINGFPCSIMGDYGITSAVIDAVVRGALGTPITAVWANGNEREWKNCGDDYFTTAPPAGAKNLLAVGAVNADDLTMTGFSSWGPLDDGRLRPDLVAPGCQVSDDQGVTSTAAGGGYSTMCGTSSAAPTVCGIAALVLQEHRARSPGAADPLPSTIKALLVHTAEDLEVPGPDYRTGYGLVQARGAIDLLRSGGMLEAQIDQGEVWSFVLELPAGAATMKATLAWDDAPAAPNVKSALVNDLDLLIEGPGGAHHPWTLDGAQPAAPAQRSGPDHANNLEQVLIDDAVPGLYTLTVSGFSVPAGPQRFSLVAPGLVGTSIVLAETLPASLEPSIPHTLVVEARSSGESIVPGSLQLVWSTDGGEVSAVAMEPIGGDRWEAELPGQSCGAFVECAFSAEGVLSGPVHLPGGGGTYPISVAHVTAHFDDDFEAKLGWTVSNGPGLQYGGWQQGVPAGTGTRGDPGADADGSGQCWVTGNGPGNTDVDGGSTTLRSPILSAGALEEQLTLCYARWFSNIQGPLPFTEPFVVEISDDGGESWRELETIGPTGAEVVGGWIERCHELADLPGFALDGALRVRFIAADPDPGSVVEAAIDAVHLFSTGCAPVESGCPADFDDSGAIDVDDLVAVILAWGPCEGSGCPDLDGDGEVGVDDLVAVIVAWGEC